MGGGIGTFSRAAAVVLLFAVCAGGVLIALGALWPDPEEGDGLAPTLVAFGEAGECASGEREACVSEGCGGERICMHGSWSGCFVYDECTPGEERFCEAYGCSSGVQTCDECGQWGECGPG